MIRHIVLFRFLDFAEGRTKEENLKLAIEKLNSLPTKIPEIKGYEVGLNIISSQRACDLSLLATFESIDDLNVYKNNPDHNDVVEFIAKVRYEAFACDYIV